jgi:prephenate dehydratase
VRVAYLGPAGTHSEEALRTSAPGAVEELPCPTIYDAVMAVQERAAERAVVPIENALEGGVAVTLDTLVLEALDVRIGAEVVHPIHHCLIAAAPLEPSSISRVVSHPQAIAQCARFLREQLPDAEHVSAPSTADAVASLREADGSTAALGTRLAAELYGCELIAPDVEDHPDNATRFVWLARAADVQEPAGPAKTTIVFWGAGDEAPGWLVDVLSELSSREVNLTRIESRPRRIRLGHYMFVADLDGAASRPPVSDALEALRSHVEEVRVLGSYGALTPRPRLGRGSAGYTQRSYGSTGGRDARGG